MMEQNSMAANPAEVVIGAALITAAFAALTVSDIVAGLYIAAKRKLNEN